MLQNQYPQSRVGFGKLFKLQRFREISVKARADHLVNGLVEKDLCVTKGAVFIQSLETNCKVQQVLRR